ncbi:hypothetical protein NESM_000236000 [Novymonas esmeraldas]|uniref:Uncharacterized protein n=1 Tax=Novymonas esmeraldas TaxID=1808958 RepID=A0AAW0F551_9TRYP
MIEDISSPHIHKRRSWGETSLRAQPSITAFSVDQGKPRADRALIVYQNVRRPSPETSEVNELLLKARVALPAIMNYLYFGSAQVAVVYFGKRVGRRGVKHGIRDGAQDLKIRLIRYFTAEMWPPLLRTDAPDESLGFNLPSNSRADSADASVLLGAGTPSAAQADTAAAGTSAAVDREARLAKETEQERLWFRRSVENHMQVLLYLKSSTDGKSKYLKVVLQNTAHRLYFDVVETREEKYRWDLRMLFIRMMDNLETQRAIDSYESYLEYFREACAMAAANALFLERPRQAMLEVVLWTTQMPSTTPTAAGPQIARRCLENRDGASADSGDEATPLLPLSTQGSQPTQRRPSSSEPPPPPEVHSCHHLTSTATEGAADATDDAAAPREDTREPDMSPVLRTPLVLPETESRSATPPAAAAAAVVASGSRLSPTTLGPRHSRTTRRRGYPWMSALQKPESTTLDYKSYFFNTALEIRHRCVKFMCGFLNAYGEGRLVVGVHEIPRPASASAEERKEAAAGIVVHNDLVDQFVVGARVTRAELEDLQVDVSEQLLCCIPPIPPRAVQVDAVPVRFPAGFAYAPQILVLYDFASTSFAARDALKQKSNYAIRFLFTLGLSIVPLDLPDDEVRALLQASASRPATPPVLDPPPLDARWCDANTEAYLIAAIDDPAALQRSDWAERLGGTLGRHKQRCYHAVLEYEPANARRLALPELFVLEVSVDIKRCGYSPLSRYKGKFFSGWPSIPLWDPTTRTVRAVERNYNVLGTSHLAGHGRGPLALGLAGRHVSPGVKPARSQGPAVSSSLIDSSTAGVADGSGCATTLSPTTLAAVRGRGCFQRQLLEDGWAWFAQPAIMARVLNYLYNPERIRDILQFRLIHPLSNARFENRQGNYLVHMIYSTPVGVPVFNAPREQLSRIQYSFLHTGIPPLPLLLCHCYETIGNLPSPYPFVAVPLVQQTFRVAPCLVPLFYRQHYFDGQLKLAVVLDLRDSLLKTVELRNGNLRLDTVVGIGFEPMNKRQLMRHFLRRDREGSGDASGGGGRGVGGVCMAGSRTNPWLRRGGPAAGSSAEEDGAVEEDDVLLKQSFLARRAFQPQAMTYATDSHLASRIASPMASARTGAVTEREVEADIPLLHFRFLSRKAVEDGRYLSREEQPRSWSRTDDATALPRAASGGRRGRPGSGSGAEQSPRSGRGAGEKGSNVVADAGELQSDANSDSADPADPAEMEAPAAHGRPWTLQHLLFWYSAFLTDREHYSVFGCGNRSIAFQVASLSEVCAECVDAAAVEAVNASLLSKDHAMGLAPSRDTCVLHQKVHDWLAV